MVRLKRPGQEIVQQPLSATSGFTLLELMIVIAMILILASFAAPTYSRIVTRSHEAILKDDLFTMRKMINQYTLDNHQPPESLDDLVKAGYFEGGLPVDPFTRSSQTWRPETDVVSINPEETFTGVVDVHSGSNARSLEARNFTAQDRAAWSSSLTMRESSWAAQLEFIFSSVAASVR
jgi:general secretion pathway protein G